MKNDALTGTPTKAIDLLKVFVVTASVMAVYEIIKELLAHGRLTPWQSHSITIAVTALIAVIATLVMNRKTINVLNREKELDVAEQNLKSKVLMATAVKHIVFNFVNEFNLVEAEGVRHVVSQIKELEAVSDLANPAHYPDHLRSPS